MNERDYQGVSGSYLIHAHDGLKQVHTRKDGTTYIIIAMHYIGYSDDIAARIETHRKGNGSRLIAAFNRAGISWELAYVWPDTDRSFERKLHRRKNSTKKLCPICMEQSRIQAIQFFNEPVVTLAMIRS